MKLLQRGMTEEDVEARRQIVPGIYLYGYCCGFFGRDSYGDKLVTQVTDDTITAVDVKTGAILHSTMIPGGSWKEIIKASNESLAEES